MACSRWAFRTSGFWFLFFMMSSNVAPVIARWNFATLRDFFLISTSTFHVRKKTKRLSIKIMAKFSFKFFSILLVPFCVCVCIKQSSKSFLDYVWSRMMLDIFRLRKWRSLERKKITVKNWGVKNKSSFVKAKRLTLKSDLTTRLPWPG